MRIGFLLAAASHIFKRGSSIFNIQIYRPAPNQLHFWHLSSIRKFRARCPASPPHACCGFWFRIVVKYYILFAFAEFFGVVCRKKFVSCPASVSRFVRRSLWVFFRAKVWFISSFPRRRENCQLTAAKNVAVWRRQSLFVRASDDLSHVDINVLALTISLLKV